MKTAPIADRLGLDDIDATRIRETTAALVESVTPWVERALDEMQDLDLGKVTAVVTDNVRRRPLQMLALAAVTGLAVGVLLRGRE